MALRPDRKRKVGEIKNIALVAHDARKADILAWAEFNVERLKRHNLWATGTTGKLLEKKLGLEINKLKSGPMGGDQMLGAMIAEGSIDLVIFMTDGLQAMPHSSDISALIRLASVYNIPIGCNKSTADFLISSHLFDEEYEIQLTDYSDYINRFDK